MFENHLALFYALICVSASSIIQHRAVYKRTLFYPKWIRPPIEKGTI